MATKTYYDTPREANKIYEQDIFVVQTNAGNEITQGNNNINQMHKIKMKATIATQSEIENLF